MQSCSAIRSNQHAVVTGSFPYAQARVENSHPREKIVFSITARACVMEPAHEVTELLIAWSNGEATALEELMPVVYDELRRVARQYMNREAGNHTLQTTALIHEAYLKLIDQKKVQWQNRAHFFAVSSQLMRRILVDMARKRHAQRRGGVGQKLSLDEAPEIGQSPARDVIAVDEALTALAALDAQKSRVVELRFFGGLSVEETAEVLKISPATVMREWKRAQAWLYSEIARQNSAAAP
jgi:RNA polymerase sigma factor (TIGR02999 family)